MLSILCPLHVKSCPSYQAVCCSCCRLLPFSYLQWRHDIYLVFPLFTATLLLQASALLGCITCQGFCWSSSVSQETQTSYGHLQRGVNEILLAIKQRNIPYPSLHELQSSRKAGVVGQRQENKKQTTSYQKKESSRGGGGKKSNLIEFSGQRHQCMCGVGARRQGQENICWLLLQDTELSEVKAACMAEIQTLKNRFIIFL